jgi:hypothetical protein
MADLLSTPLSSHGVAFMVDNVIALERMKIAKMS